MKEGRNSTKPVKESPLLPGNNINGINGDVNGDSSGVEIHELADRKVLSIQEAYVKHVIDIVIKYDNVLYEISNENHPASTEWQYHMINFIKDYEKKMPWQHPAGMTFQYRGGSNKALFDSPADWISPNPEGGYRTDPPASTGSKVILTDTDLAGVNSGNRKWSGKAFCGVLILCYGPVRLQRINNSCVLGVRRHRQKNLG